MSEWVFGINPVGEALSGRRRRPLELVAAREGNARLQELVAAAEKAGVAVRRCSRAELDRLAGGVRHQGVALRIEPFAYVDFTDLLGLCQADVRPGFILALDGITDPHNLGALVRSAAAAGCRGVILPKDNSCPVTTVVDRAAAGALEHIPLCRVVNLARSLDDLKQAGFWVYGLAGEGDQDLFGADLTGPLVLVAGSEGSGLRPNVRRRCDFLLSIPMSGGVGSLNVSVATGIALFEVVRQRRLGA
ncbi:23S rRNA (guanosine(2251)-2'-O)-methyltransferase RlmB [Geoalkalibacter halelectricus]|uniref:23S rRNA (Guanosine(2251)-2'-O)-methyltransferase RlmB n=1 Tax=Geoalkalibacter halelectricus TaxID=2847045 RepID=A0ABY5ZI97_9BACT|nr:23S rRNA (guanosine(2251)-2'-O)-methyltransferase RlmB [Geoalkalibacter halelectricus]MDO3379054.1 23S rRNA (guanosine(2251)-2'-O)-methyltransferase RlmB [Geoalkalibacter halelectricus]UWZ78867.1 23S rRNA (guanosine(2251)-2'-O)-methyltransferase RlmB [Geoalkalibacter halelectricus]